MTLMFNEATFNRDPYIDARSCRSILVTRGFAERVYIRSIRMFRPFKHTMLAFMGRRRFTFASMFHPWAIYVTLKSKDHYTQFAQAFRQAILTPETVVKV